MTISDGLVEDAIESESDRPDPFVRLTLLPGSFRLVAEGDAYGRSEHDLVANPDDDTPQLVLLRRR